MDISFLDSSYLDETHQAMKKLLNDHEFLIIAEDLLPFDLEIIAQEFNEAKMSNRSWDIKTNKEREAWKAKFNEKYNEIIELFDEGPFPPKEWGIPLKGEHLMTLLTFAKLYKTPTDIYQYYDDMENFENLMKRANLTIVDILDDYKKIIDKNYNNQILAKPRDEKALRALFIKLLNKQQYSVSQITVIVRAMLDDDLLDERTVRRLIK